MTDALSLVDDWGPEKIVVVSHRRTGMKGVLVIDNTARGVGKGGTRMSPTVTVGEVARLARVMTWKWAGVDLFYGGAKAGIAADPASRGKEAILRAFARALSNEVPREYVMGLDMGLTESDAAIIQDELGDRGAAVGTPNTSAASPTTNSASPATASPRPPTPRPSTWDCPWPVPASPSRASAPSAARPPGVSRNSAPPS